MNSCGCNKTEIFKSPSRFGCINVDSNIIGELKSKVICEFTQLLKRIEKGYKLDYNFLLDEIMLINLVEDNEISLNDTMFYLEFYKENKFNLNSKDKWQIY